MAPLFPPLPQSRNIQVSDVFRTELDYEKEPIKLCFAGLITWEKRLAGPKLYKEPSFKSNKFIIHNAITRCCLAGKVNEPQKNKIVEVKSNNKVNPL